MKTTIWQKHDKYRIRRLLFGITAIVILTVIAYAPAIRAGYIWDDDLYVTKNYLLTAPDGLVRIWFSLDSPSQYFPLVYTTFRLEHALWGLNPLGYHIVNILLHALNALLVWAVLRRLSVRGAWLAAAIFAVHPVHVESVAWITERKNVLSLLFFLLAALSWLKFTDHKTPRPWRYYMLLIFMYALSLFSKTTACTLPLALAIVTWYKGEKFDRKKLMQLVPLVLMGMAMGLVSIWWERNHQGTSGAEFEFSVLQRLFIAGRALWFYAAKLAWPTNLAFSYQRWTIDPGSCLPYIWPAACLMVAAALWVWRRKLGRGPIAAVAFFASMLLPMLGFVSLYTFRYTYAADHYQYAASIGLIALFTSAATGSWQIRGRHIRVPHAVNAGILLALTILTWNQAHIYKDSETLWRDTLAKNPSSWMAYGNMGNELQAKGKIEAAIGYYKESLQIQPNQVEAHYNLGSALAQSGDLPEALKHFDKALQIDPRCTDAHNKLGVVLASQGNTDEATQHFRKALSIDPINPDAHYNLGQVLARQGSSQEATDHYLKALEVRPKDSDAHYNLALALVQQGNVEEAISHLEEATALNPGDKATHDYLAGILDARGDTEEAALHYTASLKIDPNAAEGHNNLGRILASQGNVDKAIDHFRQAVKIKPHYALAHYNLALALYKKQQYPQAMEHTLLAKRYGFGVPREFLEAVRSGIGRE